MNQIKNAFQSVEARFLQLRHPGRVVASIGVALIMIALVGSILSSHFQLESSYLSGGFALAYGVYGFTSLALLRSKITSYFDRLMNFALAHYKWVVLASVAICAASIAAFGLGTHFNLFKIKIYHLGSQLQALDEAGMVVPSVFLLIFHGYIFKVAIPEMKQKQSEITSQFAQDFKAKKT